MRKLRIKVERSACYHVMNRVHDKAFLFDELAADMFVRIVRKVERFTGVEVLTYCIMRNHFHMLIKVPMAKELSDRELLRRYEAVAAPATYKAFRQQWDRFAKRGEESGLQVLRDRLMKRMFDLSMFMKEVKQRFTQWYNATNDREGRGSFWTDRFKSVLVEGRGNTLSTMAAYIDLNPVRAGITKDPKDFRWCGYAAALAGDKSALKGLKTILKTYLKEGHPSEILAMYRVMLFGTLDARNRGRVTVEEIEKVFKQKGMLTPWEMGKHRVKWMSNGLVIGTKKFVHSISTCLEETSGVSPPKKPPPPEHGWGMLKA